MRRRLLALCIGAGALAPALALGADWELVMYRLPANGHPCINDPYPEAGYVWIRRDADAASRREQLKAQVRGQNSHPDFRGPRRVQAGEVVYLVNKQIQCRSYGGKQYESSDYEFVVVKDEAALRSYMEDKQADHPDVRSYTYEAISRAPQDLDATGTSVVIGRAR